MQIPQTTPGAVGAGYANKALQRTGKALEKILERLANARRINRASDDAAGLSIAEQLQTQVRGFKMATQNVNDAMSALNIADGAAGATAGILQRQRELALQARNDTLTDDQRQTLDVEYQALTEELTRIADAARFNTQNVAAGEGLAAGDAQIQAGPNPGETLQLAEINLTADALGITGTAVATGAQAGAALGAIDAALATMGTQRSTLGVTVNRIESILSNLNVSAANTQAAESILRDQDMAQGITDLVREQLLREGGMRAFSRYQEITANHLYGLLQ